MSGVLLLNLNNSFAKAAIWQDGVVRHLAKHPSSQMTGGHFARWIKRSRCQRVIVASVVPTVAALLKAPHVPPGVAIHFLTHRSPLDLTLRFPSPRTIGADRLANAVAVCAFHRPPAVVVDFGTAVTFDIISRQHEYLGGVIAPGMRVFRDYLAERTALLPRIRLIPPDHVIGKSTREAMRAGAFVGYRGLVREILKEISNELGEKRLAIIATGGDSHLFMESPSLFQTYDPDLSFKGLGVIADRLAADPL